VDHLALHGVLDGVGERVDGARRVLPIGGHVRTHGDGRPERHEHARPERLASLEAEAHGDDGELGLAVVGVTCGLEVERDPGCAGPDALHAGFGVRGALGIDRDHATVPEGAVHGLEGGDVAVGGVPPVLLAVHGDRPAREEEAGHDPAAKERRGGEVVDLAPHDGAHQQRVDEIVRMIDAEQNGPVRRHALGVVDVDGAEEEPHPESGH
jgi:hypothetical protein